MTHRGNMSQRKKDHLQPLEVEVRSDNVMGAYRKLSKMVGNEGVTYELSRRQYHMKPSEKRREKRERSERRRRRENRRDDRNDRRR